MSNDEQGLPVQEGAQLVTTQSWAMAAIVTGDSGIVNIFEFFFEMSAKWHCCLEFSKKHDKRVSDVLTLKI